MATKFVWLGILAAAGTVTACSGGNEGEEAAPVETTAPTAAPSATAAATAGTAPAADNLDTVDGTKLADFTGDAAHGKVIFVQCQACHSIEPGENKIGPSLAGVVGREAGTIADFTYSDPNKNSGITWSEDKLFQYLENPQRIVPGTKMTFAGLPKAQDRADVIAYLKTGGA